MTLFYYDPVFQEHQTGNHPERPERLAQVVRHLQWTGLDVACQRPTWQPISQKRLGRIHPPEYVQQLKTLAASGGGCVEVDTVLSARSYDVAMWGAGAVCDAVTRVMRNDDRQALCLVRPPGHHALRSRGMGFCLLNNVALGARLATSEFEVDRVLVVDWDVHHGNGIQDAFWDDGRVGCFSIHRWPFYPGTGAEDETGTGEGLGATRNVPIEFGTPRAAYLNRFASELEEFAQQINPQLVLIAAGFDAHREDPIGSLGLEAEDFALLSQCVLDIAAVHAGGRVVSVLEGGYDPGALTDCIDVHLSELLAREECDCG